MAGNHFNTTLVGYLVQVETVEPSEAIVKKCPAYFAQFDARSS